MNITPHSIIQGASWLEPVEVSQVEELGDYIRIVGVMTKSRAHVDQVLPKTEIG